MSSDPNSDAVDILSELENDTQDITDITKEQVDTESEKVEISNLESENDTQDITDITKEQVDTESEKVEESSSGLINENQVKTESNEKVRNVIFVGNKTIMTYVNSTLTQLSATPVVTIKARGKRITQAVDISQFIMKRMNSVGYKISDVRISSELLVSQDGKKRNVSLLEIDITDTNT